MEKLFFAVYLKPTRPDFAMTMNESERAIMQVHVAYWTEKMKLGKVIAFGLEYALKTLSTGALMTL